jgi:hypothetical protein
MTKQEVEDLYFNCRIIIPGRNYKQFWRGNQLWESYEVDNLWCREENYIKHEHPVNLMWRGEPVEVVDD